MDGFTEGIGDFSTDELNDELVTVFGEISERLHGELDQEALAVASTIFNRWKRIRRAREAYAASQQPLIAAKLAREVAEKQVDELGKNPSRYQKELGKDEYAKKLKEAQSAYSAATREFSNAQKDAKAKNSEKLAAEARTRPNRREAEWITISDIVGVDEQYKGFAKGKGDRNDFPNMAAPEKERNLRRWQTAMAAVEQLAADPSKALPFEDLRSNKGGKRKLAQNETRIGGNDFW